VKYRLPNSSRLIATFQSGGRNGSVQSKANQSLRGNGCGSAPGDLEHQKKKKKNSKGATNKKYTDGKAKTSHKGQRRLLQLSYQIYKTKGTGGRGSSAGVACAPGTVRCGSDGLGQEKKNKTGLQKKRIRRRQRESLLSQRLREK